MQLQAYLGGCKEKNIWPKKMVIWIFMVIWTFISPTEVIHLVIPERRFRDGVFSIFFVFASDDVHEKVVGLYVHAKPYAVYTNLNLVLACFPLLFTLFLVGKTSSAL
jgi:hypothetical protein